MNAIGSIHPRGALLAALAGLLLLTGLVTAPAADAAAPAAAAATAPGPDVANATAVRAPGAMLGGASGCPTVWWSSLPKSSAQDTTAPITGVRIGRHACFDRLVIDLGSGPGSAGHQVRYVSQVYSQGRGAAVPVAGGAVIEVVVHAPAYRVSTGAATYRPASPARLADVTGYATFRQVAWGGSFEGQSTIALGVRARLPMRAFVLDGPGAGQRLVIDVAHHW